MVRIKKEPHAELSASLGQRYNGRWLTLVSPQILSLRKGITKTDRHAGFNLKGSNPCNPRRTIRSAACTSLLGLFVHQQSNVRPITCFASTDTFLWCISRHPPFAPWHLESRSQRRRHPAWHSSMWSVSSNSALLKEPVLPRSLFLPVSSEQLPSRRTSKFHSSDAPFQSNFVPGHLAEGYGNFHMGRAKCIDALSRRPLLYGRPSNGQHNYEVAACSPALLAPVSETERQARYIRTTSFAGRLCLDVTTQACIVRYSISRLNPAIRSILTATLQSGHNSLWRRQQTTGAPWLCGALALPGVHDICP
ncbi:hypothetical protein BDP55DRAFT_20375 [Colletotrichum godetiae]|uniref:Uncharacterized protein n=1 Tax=Colletotrichum godetiae TaxID=1209918 RepID=A0AAJ0AZZ3_9PEZI|nr:uncharacterized protein BDP55DRAFT_20375 [Colletotrichum godetiae]KAK1701426.1 hypothetical protein BDP55DRAFT_20375 [Colletotrichum godetiae]